MMSCSIECHRVGQTSRTGNRKRTKISTRKLKETGMKFQQDQKQLAMMTTGVLGLGLFATMLVGPSYAETPVEGARKRTMPLNPHRFGDQTLESTIRTDERYGHDGLFQGPRGWCYWNYLERPKPIQNPNLWPDMRSTYFLGRFSMPPGSSLTLRGEFPYARFFQFALYRWERDTFVAIGQSLRGPDFEPDSGSTNPFRIGADRLAAERKYTVRVLAEDEPKKGAEREKNTLYVGRGGEYLEAVIRIYLGDQDRDGPGWGRPWASFSGKGLPVYEGMLADGTRLTAE